MRIDVEGLFERSKPSPVVGLRALQDTDAALVHCVAQTVKGYHLPATSYFELQWLLARANTDALRRRAVKWRACATARNGPTESPGYTILVDTTPPLFANAVPSATAVSSSHWNTVAIDIYDNTSGVNISRIGFQCMDNADGHWSDWRSSRL